VLGVPIADTFVPEFASERLLPGAEIACSKGCNGSGTARRTENLNTRNQSTEAGRLESADLTGH
jgi:hypothetical protein